MDASIHNVCHLMNIAHCMQLPDLQLEMGSVNEMHTLIHNKKTSIQAFSLEICFQKHTHSECMRVKACIVVPPGGQLLNLSLVD